MTPCGAALKKVVYIIVLCEILCLDSILTNVSCNIYVIVKLHRLAYKFCILSCSICQFVCIAEKFVNYEIFNLYTSQRAEKKPAMNNGQLHNLAKLSLDRHY